ncbi:MAG: sodium:solute symporter family protein [Planctomycetota bacterium]
MHPLDLLVLGAYFLVMIGIGIYCSRRIKAQEDFFMGGRGFGKLIQTFAAFGAGTGSSDPVNASRTTFTSGLSGMWSVMYWLFATPFYWISGVWYRRMRHLTLGDWFVERYESQSMGAAYAIFALTFQVVYGSMLFSAIGKVAAPILQMEGFELFGATYGLEYLLVPIIGVVVLVYGIAGGLSAAYFTDLIQGLCIILLSVLLIPIGLDALVTEYGTETDGLFAGFRILHERAPKEFFTLVGTGANSEFPLHMLLAVIAINIVGIVVQPHMIATGGGSAKTEMNARVGLVVGNFLKRFCTVGWVLTALIAVALFSGRQELIEDPDRTWGLASRELLGPGLTGLMLACLLAALMSSIDAYMVVGSALVVRNIYAPYVNPGASEAQYVRVARLTGILIVGGAVVVSLFMMDVFKQLELTWRVPIIFASVFWGGMYWRRATKAAAWSTIGFCTLFFFILPIALPALASGLRDSFLDTNPMVQLRGTREAAAADVDRRKAEIESWTTKESAANALNDADDRLKALAKVGTKPQTLHLGDTIVELSKQGGKAPFWSGGVHPVDDAGKRIEVALQQTRSEDGARVSLAYPAGTKLRGFGDFRLDFLLYTLVGIDLTSQSDSLLRTMELPPKIVLPFLVLVLFSFVTRQGSKESLDRYYAKMKTPVDPDPEADRKKLARALDDPEALEKKKLFPGTSLEIQRPTRTDVVGFVISVIVCFVVIGLALGVASIGA